MAWIGPVVGAAIGGLSSMASTNNTNSANASLNQANMQWQEHMSNTAVSRRVEDMKNAGINPILAAGSAASQPSANMIPMQSNAQGFSQMGQQLANVRLTSAQANNIDADTNKKIAETPVAINQPAITDAQRLIKANADNATYMLGVTQAQANNIIANTDVAVQQLKLLSYQTSSAQAQAGQADAQARLATAAAEIGNALNGSRIPEAQAAAKLWADIGAGGKGVNFVGQALLMLKQLLTK